MRAKTEVPKKGSEPILVSNNITYNSMIEHEVKFIKKWLEENMTGFEMPMPVLKLFAFPELNVSAEFFEREGPTAFMWIGNKRIELTDSKDGKYWMIINNVEKTIPRLKFVVDHEMFHEAQFEYRYRNGDYSARIQYIINAGRKGDWKARSRAATLWEGTNEAGAYIFGSHMQYADDGLEGRGLAGKVLNDINEWNKMTISASRNEVLDLLFVKDGLESDEPEAVVKKAAPIIAAIVLEQNNFDLHKTEKAMLAEPSKIIEGIIKPMGYEGASASLERAEIIMEETNIAKYNDILRK